MAARGAREAQDGAIVPVDDPAEREALRARARGLWVRATMLGAVGTVVAAGLLLLR